MKKLLINTLPLLLWTLIFQIIHTSIVPVDYSSPVAVSLVPDSFQSYVSSIGSDKRDRREEPLANLNQTRGEELDDYSSDTSIDSLNLNQTTPNSTDKLGSNSTDKPGFFRRHLGKGRALVQKVKDKARAFIDKQSDALDKLEEKSTKLGDKIGESSLGTSVLKVGRMMTSGVETIAKKAVMQAALKGLSGGNDAPTTITTTTPATPGRTTTTSKSWLDSWFVNSATTTSAPPTD